jgi:hypothetical protein
MLQPVIISVTTGANVKAKEIFYNRFLSHNLWQLADEQFELE